MARSNSVTPDSSAQVLIVSTLSSSKSPNYVVPDGPGFLGGMEHSLPGETLICRPHGTQWALKMGTGVKKWSVATDNFCDVFVSPKAYGLLLGKTSKYFKVSVLPTHL